jgi:hypothetical protein
MSSRLVNAAFTFYRKGKYAAMKRLERIMHPDEIDNLNVLIQEWKEKFKDEPGEPKEPVKEAVSDGFEKID